MLLQEAWRASALNTLFYLCQLNRANQAKAAKSGLIRPLIAIIGEKGSLKEIALSIFFDLLHASPETRVFSQLVATTQYSRKPFGRKVLLKFICPFCLTRVISWMLLILLLPG